MNKKNLVLGGIFILLVVAAYVYSGPWQDWKNSAGQPDNILADYNIDSAGRIELARADESVVLERNGEKWKIAGTNEFYVRTDKIDGLIAAFNEAKAASVELVSQNKDKKEELETADNGIRVKFYNGGDIFADFIIGKITGDYLGSYISLPESDKTYAVKVNLTAPFGPNDWYDREIFSANKEDIDKIRFQYPTREFTIEKQEDKWIGTLPYRFTVDNDKVDEVLTIMSNLSAAGVPEQSFAGTGLEKNSIIIQATGESVDHVLMIGDANDKKQYYVKRGDSDNIYLITEEKKNILDKQIRDLQ